MHVHGSTKAISSCISLFTECMHFQDPCRCFHSSWKPEVKSHTLSYCLYSSPSVKGQAKIYRSLLFNIVCIEISAYLAS